MIVAENIDRIYLSDAFRKERQPRTANVREELQKCACDRMVAVGIYTQKWKLLVKSILPRHVTRFRRNGSKIDDPGSNNMLMFRGSSVWGHFAEKWSFF